MKRFVKGLLRLLGYQITKLPPTPIATIPEPLPVVEPPPVEPPAPVVDEAEPAPEPAPVEPPPRKVPRRSLWDSMEHIGQLSAKLGFEPKTVIDIGAADGTPELYHAFPQSRFFLVEPLQEYEDSLKAICEQVNATYVIAAVGDRNGSITISITPDLYGSSVMIPGEPHLEFKQREVPIATLDRLVEEHGLEGPFILKSDAQGSELAILKGSGKTLEQSEIVILEVQFFQFVKDGALFYDNVAFLKEAGFVVYDIVGHNYRFLDDALAEVDLVFVREKGLFRQSHFFATPVQRDQQFEHPDQRY